jgi:signal transduction histidine kinase
MAFHDPKHPVRVLLVEDSPEDAELITGQLEDAGLHFVFERVEDGEALSQALDEFQPELILSDLSLPGYSGHEALALVRQRSPDTPFIFVSGTIGEETAIEALRQGAADYILKQNMARLAAAAERAVREAQAERERRLAEAELLRAQRMESLALLTSGLGHDLRNVLQPLLIVPSIIRDHADTPQLLKLADLVHDCASRGLDMVGSMLSFARGDGSADEEIDVDTLLDALRLMMQGSLPRQVELKLEGRGRGLNLRANRTEIQQCLLNLTLNAAQAMPEGGTIRVVARPGENHIVVLAVSDTGVGMDQDTQDQLFTPFFTTRTDGTGLGLHSCRRIIESHGGWIELASSPGAGTTFELHLPSAHAPADDGAIAGGHGQRVLVVDEDPSRAHRLGRRLEARGYRVVLAGDGATAL